MDVKRLKAKAADGKTLEMYDHNRFERNMAFGCVEKTTGGIRPMVCRDFRRHLFRGHPVSLV